MAASVAVIAVDFFVTRLLITLLALTMAVETLQSPEATVRDPDQPVIALEHVSLAFDEKVILKDVSFTLLPGHTKIILGASGSGKSTILKLILGLLKPDGGSIVVNGQRWIRCASAS